MIPCLTTERLFLRPFTPDDVDAILAIYGDREANTFLPWFPVKSREEAAALYESRYARPEGYRWAVCLKADDVPIGYVHVSAGDSRDLGYGLRHEYWNRGLMTEACRAVLPQLAREGLPFVTATHDVKNPASGAVMRKLGMRYCYSYIEQWQPKNISVTFRMYQLNLDGRDDRVYRKYWEQYPDHFIEAL